jgi:hypothetical protein
MDNQERRSPELKTAALFTLAAVFIYALGAPLRQKVVPGGPFISLFGEAIPVAFSLRAIFVSLKGFSRMPVEEKLWAVFVFFLATIVIAWAFESVLTFWFCPYARGHLLGP